MFQCNTRECSHRKPLRPVSHIFFYIYLSLHAHRPVWKLIDLTTSQCLANLNLIFLSDVQRQKELLLVLFWLIQHQTVGKRLWTKLAGLFASMYVGKETG